MVQRMPEGDNDNFSADFSAEIITNILNRSLDENHKTNRDTPEIESNSNAANRILPNVSKAQSGKSEWMVQDEPGVYISLSSLPNGGNELQRVRFRYLCFAIL